MNEARTFSWARVERTARRRFGIECFRPGQRDLLHGDAVAHGRFGRGEVIAADAEGITVVFTDAGEKRVDATYLTRIESEEESSEAA